MLTQYTMYPSLPLLGEQFIEELVTQVLAFQPSVAFTVTLYAESQPCAELHEFRNLLNGLLGF